ncbi:hypothetical protein FSARC_4255 [Fusarium sarcochroum]|uniref:Uncharacterized protein n=1 Tax=Fusarium sarcochroum TaxID=1208366 RepID=A0A8H4U1V0_9HYPO|nr:hypothetical protein FSARC_4255 [Fusarium sarcochroum]
MHYERYGLELTTTFANFHTDPFSARPQISQGHQYEEVILVVLQGLCYYGISRSRPEGEGNRSRRQRPSTYSFYLRRKSVQVQLRRWQKFQVPRGVINKYPAFAKHFRKNEIDLPNLEEREGHTIIHFLLTGTYDCLAILEDDEAKKKRQALLSSLSVYFFATGRQLDPLAALMMSEITEMGDRFSFPDLIRLLDEDDLWIDSSDHLLADYLKKRAAMEAETVTEQDATNLSADIGSQCTLTNILLETIVSMKLQLQKRSKPKRSQFKEKGRGSLAFIEMSPVSDFGEASAALAGEDASLPTESMYAGDTFGFHCRSGKTFHVPWRIIDKYPALAQACRAGGPAHMYDFLFENEAHVVIHFLFAESYQRIGTSASIHQHRENMMFEGLRVYVFAIEYGIEPLARLAMHEIEKAGEHFALTTLITILADVGLHITLRHHLLADYLAQKAAMLDDDLTETDARTIRCWTEENRNMECILLETIVKMKLDLQRYQKIHGPLPKRRVRRFSTMERGS